MRATCSVYSGSGWVCPNEPVPGYRMCAEHREQRYLQLLKHRANEGMCNNCTAQAVAGQVLCIRHRAENLSRITIKRRSNLVAGLCARCSTPVGEKTMCPKHLADNRTNTAASRARAAL